MTIHIDRPPGRNLTIFVVRGRTSLEEQLAALSDYYEHDTTKDVMWDFTELTGTRLTTEELKQIIAFIGRQGDARPGGRTALVAKSDLDYGLSRMVATMADLDELPWEMRAFRSREEALAWLGAA